jgi:23S rRNA (pseudouridine1915-N3)-methyltransferase
MFKIRIIAVGKNKEPWIEQAIEHYLKLLKKYCRVEIVYTSEVKKTKALSDIEAMRREAAYIDKHLDAEPVFALCDNGRKMNSLKFSSFIEKLMLESDRCAFIIGGAYGIDGDLMKRSRDKISLSPMTMSHQLVRPVLLEQLYRAFSIFSGGKYHK